LQSVKAFISAFMAQLIALNEGKLAAAAPEAAPAAPGLRGERITYYDEKAA
jgi:hypothetical protein